MTHNTGSLPEAVDLLWKACDSLRGSLGSECIALTTQCMGRIVSETVFSPVALPSSPVSTRDGYAMVASKDPADRSVPIHSSIIV